MAMEEPWKPFEETMNAPLERAREWKERTGGKVIGHVLPDVPEELIHAAGALPLALEGARVDPYHAQAHLPGYTCAHAMGTIEMGLTGDLDFLDGVVIPYVCDTTRNLFHLWERLLPEIPAEFLRIPKRLDIPGAGDYLAQEYARLGRTLAVMTGSQPTDDRLKESIDLYNRSRARLREAYGRHKESPSLWTAHRLRAMIGSALRAPREEHLQWMDSLPWNDRPVQDSEDRVSVYVRGKVWDPPALTEMLDDLGFRLVGDELVTGFRSVECDASPDNDPFRSLVDRHMATMAYTGYHMEPRELVDRFIERVRSSGAQGVLFLNPKFCEAAGFDTPDFRKALEDRGISTLVLETSTPGVAPGRIQVRLEAFREMLGDDLP